MPPIGELVVEGDETYINLYHGADSRYRLNISDDIRNQLHTELSARIEEIESNEYNDGVLKPHLRATVENL